MLRLTRKQTFALVFSLLCILAAALWLILRFRPAPSNASLTGVCGAWEQADTVNQGLGWDLTYMSLLKRVGFCPGHPACEEWAKPEPPINKLVAEWQEDPIISSIEFEVPDGHADMVSIWLIRTKDKAYYSGFSGEGKSDGKHLIPTQVYDSMFEAMVCWSQDEPPIKTFGCEPSGYAAFLSLYKEGRSRQMLLTCRDIFDGNWKTEEGKPGRFSLAIKPLLPLIDEWEKQPAPDSK